MKKSVLIGLLVIGLNITASAADFIICKSKYALCTTAKCLTLRNKKDTVACQCDVKTGFSVGKEPCKPVKQTAKEELVYSRYYPIKSYVVCSNDRPWAWCLDKPCIINKNSPSSAVCFCDVVESIGKYIIVTNSYNPTTCTTGIISSATVNDATQITDFLKTQKDLKPFPIRIINR